MEISDVQLVVTGKIKTQIQEDPLEATIREGKEETGFNFEMETVYGLGKDGDLIFTRGSFHKKKVYPSVVRIKKILKKHVNFKHSFDDNDKD